MRKIGTENNWKERKNFLLPLEFRSIQDIKDQDKSLGLIKPKTILKYFSKSQEREWESKKQAILDQMDLFDPPIDLEKIPYKFIYKFIDQNEDKHGYSIIDWEICQLYRNCRD